MSTQVSEIAAGLSRLAAMGRSAMWQSAAEIGLTPTQAEILQRIALRPERASDLAAHLGVTAATISDSVAALLAKGLVTRCPDPADRRARHLTPTDAGRQALDRIPHVPAPLHRAITGLPETDRGALLRLLVHLIRSLQEARAIPVQRMCVTCRHFRPHAHPGAAAPHHCDFVNATFADAGLRLDCREHAMAQAEQVAANWQRLDAA
jgi:DNA-binding MarR family transcriptional regulator